MLFTTFAPAGHQLHVAVCERESAQSSSVSCMWFISTWAFYLHLQMLEETLSPMWNELLLFDQLIIDGKKEELKTETPIIIINLFSQNKFVSMAILPSSCFQKREGREALCAATSLFGFYDSAWSSSTGDSESWGLWLRLRLSDSEKL